MNFNKYILNRQVSKNLLLSSLLTVYFSTETADAVYKF